MTEKQMQYLAAGLKEAGRAQFAQPQQAAVATAMLDDILKPHIKDDKVRNAVVTEFTTAFGPFFNASAVLQTLKKLGIISSELTSAQKAAADVLTKALKA